MRNTFILLILVFIGMACTPNKSENNRFQRIPKNKYAIQEIKFPKIVKLNDSIKGELIFDVKLDSSLESRLIKRFTFLYVSSEELDSLSAKVIQNVEHKTFVDTLFIGKFLFNASFPHVGANVLSFVIEDNLLLKPLDSSSKLDVKTIEYGTEIVVEVIN